MKRLLTMLSVGIMLASGHTSQAATTLPDGRQSWSADNGNGTYTNPLFYDEFSDPDILRVGEDYYLAGTTMHTVPGLVILHSKDLVNWENVSYCFDRFDFDDDAFSLKNGKEIYGQGIWAPCIRYNDGKFYLYSNVNGKGLQCFVSDKIEGPWKHINMQGKIYDLSVLFDDDGKVYAIHGYGEVKCTELKPDMSGPIEETERVIIPEGNAVGEGHHMYKIDGKYYLISTDYMPNGRTLCSRADNIWGPYETRVITADETFGYHTPPMTQIRGRIMPDNHPVSVSMPDKDKTAATNAHQGGIVSTPDGQWWALLMQDFHSIGRTTTLAPITWVDGWPMFGLEGNLGRAPRTWFKPVTAARDTEPIHAPYQRNEDFNGKTLGRVWQWNHNPEEKMWSLKNGRLRLNTMPADQLMWARNTLTQRAIGPESIVTVEMDASGMKDGDVAGLGNINVPCSWIGLVKDGKNLTLRRFEQLHNDTIDVPVKLDNGKIWLRLHGDYDNDKARYWYSTDGENFKPLGNDMILSYQLITFQGSRPSLFAFNKNGRNGGYAEFDNFTVEEPKADRSGYIPFGKTFRIINLASGLPMHATPHGLMHDTGVDNQSPQTYFKVIDRGGGKVALQCADGRYVFVAGEGLPGDIRFTTDESKAEEFMWQDFLDKEFMLMSMRNHRYMGKSPTTGSSYSMDFKGSDPARRNGAVFRWEDGKTIDGGGSGKYKAVAVREPSLPGYTIYRPSDLKGAVDVEGPLPLMVFANGACNDSSQEHERLLNDLASHGYIIVALGEMQMEDGDRELGKSKPEEMPAAIDWAEKAVKDPRSEYCGMIDLEYIAMGGMSCGGALTMANAGDPRVKTYIMFNSGMGDISMGGADKESLKKLNGPILYLDGGDTDIAHGNALKDYDRIDHVPVAFASQLKVGHGGTFRQKFGGSFSPMARAWLDWQFKDRRNMLDVFLRNRLQEFPDYTMKAKNFPETNDPYSVRDIDIPMKDGSVVKGQAFIPNAGKDKYPIAIMAHGFNGTHHEPLPFAQSLAMRGVASYVFDFPDGSVNSASGNNTLLMSVPRQKGHVLEIADYVKNLDFVDSESMALLGCSQGGLVASLASAAKPELFKSLVLVYPALTIPDTAPMVLERFEAAGNEPQEVMGIKLSRNYYDSILGMNAYDSIPAYKKDVFIVYGDKDFVAAGAEKATGIYEKAEKLVVPGGDHGFSNPVCHEQATGGIVNFLCKTLLPRPKRGEWKFDSFDPDVHDPVMAKENGRYYMFTTGMGVGMLSSGDLKEWKIEKGVLDPIPAWASEPVPAYRGHTWAPDVIKVGDRWYLYYSCSTFGKNISAIGVATNRTLDPASSDYKWEDLGMVIKSEPGVNDWNAIDPNVVLDKKGNPWMTYGSFWDGIQLVALEKDMKTPKGDPKTIARRRQPCSVAHNQPTANTNAIEAPFIVNKDGWYYLFVSYDYCCKGLSSNYKTAVGRSRNVEGPYLDKSGRDMLHGAGEVIAQGDERYSGVGHCSVYEMDGRWHFFAHGYDKSKNGASKLVHRNIEWKDGWPQINESIMN